MANHKHVELLKKGATEWNQWRRDNPNITPDLRRAELQEEYLAGYNLCKADLRKARLQEADLRRTDFTNADLRGVKINDARAPYADFTESKLQNSYLLGSDFREAVFSGADLSSSNLICTQLVQANFTNANLAGCKVYGTSVWEAKLDGANQNDLVITPPNTSNKIVVGDIEVAQFLYLMLENQKLRNVIDTVTTKVVLLLGRFSSERKQVLDTLKSALREHGYIPVLFDFDPASNLDISDTVTLLARMARFVIADLSDPRSVQQELSLIVPQVVVAIQPIIVTGQEPWSMFDDLRRRSRGVLPIHEYSDVEELRRGLPDNIIAPAEVKRAELLPN